MNASPAVNPARAAVIALLLLLLLPAAATAATAPNGATGFALPARVELAWNAVPSASAYAVYRGTTATTITTRVTPVGGVLGTSFSDTSAANGTTYYYAVRSIEAGFESANSAVVQATPAARSCSVGNPTVLENCLPGSSTWPTHAVNTFAAGGIEGFATAQSIDKGQSVDLKVRTAVGAPYNLEIYRSGYYGGTGARLVSTIRGLTGVAQPNCTNDGNTGLYDCGNWAATATINTTSSWPSGMYLVRLVRTDNNNDNHIVFTVRDDSRTPDVVWGAS
ncbi:MAG TPA: N,N-dimethylformamidase beta subunit family domain-containing protein, partial [Solirubrobacter sp.]